MVGKVPSKINLTNAMHVWAQTLPAASSCMLDAYPTNDVISADYWHLHMKTSDLPRHQLIERLMAQHTEKVADASIELWEQMASQIISIIGEEGFNSLYARSVFLAQQTFPWLAASSLSPQGDQRFADLKRRFEGQMPSQTREANGLLLITLTDILASLIGEPLTAAILRSAWGNDASYRQ